MNYKILNYILSDAEISKNEICDFINNECNASDLAEFMNIYTALANIINDECNDLIDYITYKYEQKLK